jgi:hypothetical protein
MGVDRLVRSVKAQNQIGGILIVTRAMMRAPGARTKPPLRFRAGKTHNDPNFRPEPGAWRSVLVKVDPTQRLACQMWPRNPGVGSIVALWILSARLHAAATWPASWNAVASSPRATPRLKRLGADIDRHRHRCLVSGFPDLGLFLCRHHHPDNDVPLCSGGPRCKNLSVA